MGQMRVADQVQSPLIGVVPNLPKLSSSVNINCMMLEPCAVIKKKIGVIFIIHSITGWQSVGTFVVAVVVFLCYLSDAVRSRPTKFIVARARGTPVVGLEHHTGDSTILARRSSPKGR
ncbi:hypothetical protein TNCV_2513861 [Trichonephila clavipes]|nr:hypothetical protein TNCV_2513861 [Trichonephila clavipes]